jgi:vacuolar-type H+-ATPase subunit B/Vma2
MNSSLDWAVPRRRYANYAQGRDTAAMKAVVGEESLGPEDKVLGRSRLSFRAHALGTRSAETPVPYSSTSSSLRSSKGSSSSRCAHSL